MANSKTKSKLLRRTRIRKGTMLFKERLLKKVLRGQKTQTRRTHKRTLKPGRVYGIRSSYFGKPEGHIKILRTFKQRLGDISLEDVQKEGFKTLEEFQREWIKINGKWDPNQTVTVYEFQIAEEKINQSKIS
jgi:hypothetical protein